MDLETAAARAAFLLRRAEGYHRRAAASEDTEAARCLDEQARGLESAAAVEMAHAALKSAPPRRPRPHE